MNLIFNSKTEQIILTLIITIFTTGCASITLPKPPSPLRHTMQTPSQAIAESQPQPTSNWIVKTPLNLPSTSIDISHSNSDKQNASLITQAINQNLEQQKITNKKSDLKLIITITPTTTKDHTINIHPAISDDEYKRYDLEYTAFRNKMNQKIGYKIKQYKDKQHDTTAIHNNPAIQTKREVEQRKAKRQGEKFDEKMFHQKYEHTNNNSKYHEKRDNDSFGDIFVGVFVDTITDSVLDIPSTRKLIQYRDSVPTLSNQYYTLRRISNPKTINLKTITITTKLQDSKNTLWEYSLTQHGKNNQQIINNLANQTTKALLQGPPIQPKAQTISTWKKGQGLKPSPLSPAKSK